MPARTDFRKALARVKKPDPDEDVVLIVADTEKIKRHTEKIKRPVVYQVTKPLGDSTSMYFLISVSKIRFLQFVPRVSWNPDDAGLKSRSRTIYWKNDRDGVSFEYAIKNSTYMFSQRVSQILQGGGDVDFETEYDHIYYIHDRNQAETQAMKVIPPVFKSAPYYEENLKEFKFRLKELFEDTI